MSHVPVIMSHVTHKNKSCHAYEQITNHVTDLNSLRNSRVENHRECLNVSVSHMNEPCRRCDWVTPPTDIDSFRNSRIKAEGFVGCQSSRIVRMSHVTHMNEARDTYEWGTWHIWMSHVKHMHEARHTYEWVMSNIWMSHVTHVNQSCHTYEGIVWHMVKSRYTYCHVTHINKPCLIYKQTVSHI